MRYPVAILAVAAVALAACDRPANTAYNNSGQSAATAPGPTSQSATSDTASPSVAPVATGDETGMSRKIMTAIASDPAMQDADVTVKTENGVVTLGGTAKSQDQVALATGIATKQQGVARVESQIAVN